LTELLTLANYCRLPLKLLCGWFYDQEELLDEFDLKILGELVQLYEYVKINYYQ